MLVSALPFFPQPFPDHHYGVCCCPSLLTCKVHPSPASEFILLEIRPSPLLPTSSIQDRLNVCNVHIFWIKRDTADHPTSTPFPNTQNSLNSQPTTFILFPINNSFTGESEKVNMAQLSTHKFKYPIMTCFFHAHTFHPIRGLFLPPPVPSPAGSGLSHSRIFHQTSKSLFYFLPEQFVSTQSNILLTHMFTSKHSAKRGPFRY